MGGCGWVCAGVEDGCMGGCEWVYKWAQMGVWLGECMWVYGWVHLDV